MQVQAQLLCYPPYFGWVCDDADPDVTNLAAKIIGIDNHIDVPLNTTELPGPEIDLAANLKTSGLAAICMTFALDYQKLINPEDAYALFLNSLEAMDIILKNNQMNRALTLKDLKDAHGKKQPIVIQSVEGAHFLEGNIERLSIAYNRGLWQLGLLHDNPAPVPLGDIYTKGPIYNGLTDFGKEVIKECNRLGILIDLTHTSNDTDEAIEISYKPVLISHTGLNTRLGSNPEMAKMMMPRHISEKQAKKVADSGGAIGVCVYLSDTPCLCPK